jgi:hypothetical protein
VRLASLGSFLDAAPVVEKEVSIAGALDALEKLLGDDLVGIDVGAIEGNGMAGENVDGLHYFASVCAG